MLRDFNQGNGPEVLTKRLGIDAGGKAFNVAGGVLLLMLCNDFRASSYKTKKLELGLIRV